MVLTANFFTSQQSMRLILLIHHQHCGQLDLCDNNKTFSAIFSQPIIIICSSDVKLKIRFDYSSTNISSSGIGCLATYDFASTFMWVCVCVSNDFERNIMIVIIITFTFILFSSLSECIYIYYIISIRISIQYLNRHSNDNTNNNVSNNNHNSNNDWFPWWPNLVAIPESCSIQTLLNIVSFRLRHSYFCIWAIVMRTVC